MIGTAVIPTAELSQKILSEEKQLAQAPGDNKWQKQDLNSSLLIQSFLSKGGFALHAHTLEIFDDICGH